MMDEAKHETYPAAKITPLELEEGVPSTEVPVASTKPQQQKSTCQRYVGEGGVWVCIGMHAMAGPAWPIRLLPRRIPA